MNRMWRAFEADPLQGTATGPYPGLRPFLPRERDVFFGREQMIDQVLVRLNERHMVVVHGASGCGKSSLIAAGVLPQLARRRARRGLVLKTGTFRPGITPIQSLVGLLGELCGTEAGPASLEEVYRAISGGGEARAGVARLAAAAGVDQICIVVDQFEELFRFAEDEGFEEAQRFAELLVQLCGCGEDEAGWWEAGGEGEPAPREADGAEVSFILTMRSEFLGNCARYPGLAEAINRTQYLLPNMARADLVRAIREPAEVFEGGVDHALAERMASDAAREEDSLPLVQHALMQMWHASDNGRLTLADYERALEACAQSEASKQRAPLSAILAGHADRVLDEVTGDDKARRSAAEFIFRALTRKDGESRAIRCPQRFWRLARLSGVSREETLAIVDGFRRDGVSFLTPYAAMAETIDGDTVVDISHEALIRAWPRMSDKAIDSEDAQPVGWIEREAQDAMLWRWLSVHAEFFRSNPRAYLDGATTERLGKWFERIRRRPDWVRPYLVRGEGRDDVTQEPEWRAVEQLLKESHDRNWLDRTMLSRWRKLGWLSLLLLILVVAAAGFGGVKLWQWYRGKEQVFERARETSDARRQVAASVRVTDELLRQDDKPVANRSAASAESVDDRTARAATGGAGSVIVGGASEGFVWAGSTDPSGVQTAFNLRDRQGRPVDVAAVRPGRDYVIVRNTIVRSAYPQEEGTPAASIGLITSASRLRITGVRRVQTDSGFEIWAKANLTPTTLPILRMTYVNDPAGENMRIGARLATMGYRLAPARPSPDAAGHADAIYCHQEDRPAAIRLAATVTRQLAGLPATAGTVVAPRLGDACDGIPRNMLTLLIDFTPPVAGAGP